MFGLKNKIKTAARLCRTQEESGAYLIEYLAFMLMILGIIFLIFQVSLALMQGIVFNHALNIAAQQAATRGGMDASIQKGFESRLLPGTRLSSSDTKKVNGADIQIPSIEAFTYNSGNSPRQLGTTTTYDITGTSLGGVGREPTKFGEVFCVRGRYKPQGLAWMGLSGIISRTSTVSSQSSQQGANPGDVPSHDPCSEAP